MRIFFNIVLSLLVPGIVFATSFIRPYGASDYAGGTKAVGTKVNAEFAYISSWLNGGNIATGNIAAFGVATSNIANGAVTNIKLADANIKFSVGSGSTTLDGAYDLLQVANLSTTITTVGRPVRISLQTSGDTTTCAISPTKLGYVAFTGAGGEAYLYALRDSSTTMASFLSTNTLYRDCSAYSYTDQPAAGTYTYSIKATGNGASSGIQVCNCKLVVYEM